MKIWSSFGSEHSANLVMIGRFKEITDAKEVEEIIDTITQEVMSEEKDGLITIGENSFEYTENISNLLNQLKLYSLTPNEVEQFAYDVSIERNEKEIVLTTNEIDISAFLKIMFYKGAKIEVYSAHHNPGTGYGR